jgi:radical SAM protein with 4Fe4S-binding SPASM domain
MSGAQYNWKDRIPNSIKIEHLTADEKYKLIDSDVFCILPWVHLSVEPNGSVLPCCIGKTPIGNSKKNSLIEIWNDTPMTTLRKAMLENVPSAGCKDCYELESVGFASLRNGCNKTYGHHIKKIKSTSADGNLSKMKLYYWDVRFSNICNLKCRMCSTTYSSRWHEDDVKLNNRKLSYKPIQFAGSHKDDLWEQIQEHLPYVEHVYFAGGEPLMMEEHNRILKLLIKLNNTKVHLTYATNLTELTFKNQSVLELWKHFSTVSVNASLDDMGDRASVIRSGTDWAQVEQNIRDLKRECPHVDFMISPTISVMNIWNICKFHRYMVDRELIEPKDFNINILQGPQEYRIDILPTDIKLKLKQEIEQHLEWLRPLDLLQRATTGFESVINYMIATDNTALLPKFWKTADSLDLIRSENLIGVVPELKSIEQYRNTI